MTEQAKQRSGGLIRTYSLAEVAAAVLPQEMKAPELWLTRRLLRGEIPGYKAGRHWRMTAQDVEALVESLRNIPIMSLVDRRLLTKYTGLPVGLRQSV